MTNFFMNSLGLGGKTFKIRFSNNQDLLVFCCCEAQIDHQTFVALKILESDLKEVPADEIVVKEVVRNEQGGWNMHQADDEIATIIIAAIGQNDDEETSPPTHWN